jgi:hypothetical protein
MRILLMFSSTKVFGEAIPDRSQIAVSISDLPMDPGMFCQPLVDVKYLIVVPSNRTLTNLGISARQSPLAPA